MVGEHIRILKGGRWVHAIDCGDETVLHLVEEAPPPRVRRAYRPEFVAGAAAVEIVTHRERTFPAKDIVRRAYSRASDPALASMFRDSEAFVEWCTTGRLSGLRNVALGAPAVPPPAPAAAAPASAVKPAAPKRAARAVRPPKAAKATPRARPAARAKPGKRAKPAKPVKAKAKAAARRAPPKPARRKSAKAKPARRAAKPVRKGKSRR